MSETTATYFEGSTPIVRVSEMKAAVRYYVDVLGFKEADWGNEFFTSVNRDRAAIYLSCGGQGHLGSWVWVGVGDATAVHEELKAKGALIQQGPRNYPWALEIHVRDMDGNVLRMGSEPREDRPYEEFLE